MTTRYVVFIHCDERRSHECHGVLEGSRPHPFGDERVLLLVEEKGWLRGYRADQTYDVCPACRPAVERDVRGT